MNRDEMARKLAGLDNSELVRWAAETGVLREIVTKRYRLNDGADVDLIARDIGERTLATAVYLWIVLNRKHEEVMKWIETEAIA